MENAKGTATPVLACTATARSVPNPFGAVHPLTRRAEADDDDGIKSEVNRKFNFQSNLID